MPENEVRHTREPIISVLGHVDHGKTTLLDWIRGSVVASREEGGITQHIGATDVPFDTVKKICGSLLGPLADKINLRGLLFIDTPGHAAFTNLRKRGGSVADLAVLVVDINEGLMPQTIEAIQILKSYKTPFVVAANKTDAIAGFRPGIKAEEQHDNPKKEFYDKFYKLVWQLSEQGFDSQIYDQVSDFKKEVAIVPVSAKLGEGIPELLMILIGLAQQYLTKQLAVEIESPAKGSILEVKEEKGLGTTIDVIIYDGVIRKNDPIVVGALGAPIQSKVKALLKPKPLDEMRDPRERFQSVNAVYAAAGIKISGPNLEKALAGAPLYVGGQEVVEAVRREIENVEINTDAKGLIIKADTIGALEALIKILSEEKIAIKKATIGKVTNLDIIEAASVAAEDKYLGAIMSFNSEILRDAKTLAQDKGVKIFDSKIIYTLIDDYKNWVKREKEKEKAEKEGKVSTPAKIKLLPGFVFRESKPAIVGVEIISGTLHTGARLMRTDLKVVGRVKGIQRAKENIKSASAPEKVAISIENVTIGRQLSPGDLAYVHISTDEMSQMNKDELTTEELSILREMRDLKRAARESEGKND